MIELEMEGVVKMLANDKKLIAVIGATGQQGGGFVRSNCSRKQSNRPGTDPVFDVGPGKFPGSA